MTNQQIKPLIPACPSIGRDYFELGALCDIERGITFPASEKTSKNTEKSIACLRTANVQKEVDWDDLIYVPLHYVKNEEKLLRPGDILISMANSLELVGKVAFVHTLREQATFGGFISAIRANAKIIPSYLFYFLKQASIQEEIRSTASRSVNIANLSLGKISQIKILVPPLDEQRRIVAKLEAVLAQTRAARTVLERVPVLLKVFRQSVLAAAFRGELTERDPNDEPASVLLGRIRAERRRKWEDGLRAKGKDPARAVYEEPLTPDTSKLPELPEGWVWTTLQMIADVRSGVTKGRDLSKFKTIEVPYLRVANVQAGYLDLREVKRISIKEDELDGYRLQVNDVLYTEGGDRDKLGRGTVWKGEVDPCIHQNHIFCARLYLPDINPEWVSMTGQLEYARNYVDSVASQSVNLASINSTNLKAMPVPLPPKEEQLRIMEKVTALMQRAQVAEQAFVTASNQTSNLEQQILIKAFRGDL